MNEGGNRDDYLIVFDEVESEAATAAYDVQKFLPGYKVAAILGWDDFLVKNAVGDLFRVPTVPLVQEYLEKQIDPPDTSNLDPDERFTGKIKWYVQPLVFGGDPTSEDNMTWVDLLTHQKLVCWWNEKYRDVAAE